MVACSNPSSLHNCHIRKPGFHPPYVNLAAVSVLMFSLLSKVKITSRCWTLIKYLTFIGLRSFYPGSNKEINCDLPSLGQLLTLTKASLQSEACSELRGLVTLSLLALKERWVKLVPSEDLLTCRKQTPSFNAEEWWCVNHVHGPHSRFSHLQ